MESKSIKHINLLEAASSLQTEALGVDREVLFVDDISKFEDPTRPRRLGFTTHCLCTAGSASFRINSQSYTLGPGDFLIGTSEQVIDNCQWSDDFQAHFMLVASRYSQDSLMGLQRYLPYLVFLLESPVLSLSTVEAALVSQAFRLIQQRLQESDNHFQRQQVALLINAFYFDVCNFLHRRYYNHAFENQHSGIIFEKFVRLLGENFREHRDLSWYSTRLCLSPKYLSEVVKRVSGRTAGQWVTLVVLLEVKMLLSCSDLSIKEIALRLHFSSQSFLGKYFKAGTGLSPSAYRRR